MEKLFESGQTLQAITVMHKYEDLGEQFDERYEGFLTSSNHAMYIEGQALMFVPVKPTNDPAVYLAAVETLQLGIIHDPLQIVLIIESFLKKLQNMTAYEFLAKIMMSVKQEVDFEDFIVPDPTILESGVA